MTPVNIYLLQCSCFFFIDITASIWRPYVFFKWENKNNFTPTSEKTISSNSRKAVYFAHLLHSCSAPVDFICRCWNFPGFECECYGSGPLVQMIENKECGWRWTHTEHLFFHSHLQPPRFQKKKRLLLWKKMATIQKSIVCHCFCNARKLSCIQIPATHGSAVVWEKTKKLFPVCI